MPFWVWSLLKGYIRTFPTPTEGELTRLRSALVAGKHWPSCRKLNWETIFIWVMGRKREAEGTNRPIWPALSKLLIAAIYLDKGLEAPETSSWAFWA